MRKGQRGELRARLSLLSRAALLDKSTRKERMAAARDRQRLLADEGEKHDGVIGWLEEKVSQGEGEGGGQTCGSEG